MSASLNSILTKNSINLRGKKICFLFSYHILDMFKGHLRNIFYHENMDYIFPKGHISTLDYITSKNSYYYDSNSSLLQILNNYEVILVTETFTIENWFFKKDNQYHVELKKFLLIKEKTPIIFLTHGFTCVYSREAQKKIFKRWVCELNNKKSNIYFVVACQIIYELLKNDTNKENHKKIIKVAYLPQFNRNLLISNNKNYENSIIILPTLYDEDCIKDIEKILSILKKKYHYCDIIIKVKDKAMFDVRCSKFFESMKKIDQMFSNNFNSFEVTVMTLSGQVFHTSKLVICLNGGTSFFEYLNYNNKTIWFHSLSFSRTDRVNFYECIPIKFNKLFISNDLKQFEEYLVQSQNENYFDKTYQDEKKRIFKFQTGNIKLLDNENNFLTNILNKIELNEKWYDEFLKIQNNTI